MQIPPWRTIALLRLSRASPPVARSRRSRAPPHRSRASPSSFPRPPSSFPRRREPSATITRIPTKVANNPHHRRPPLAAPPPPPRRSRAPRSSWPRRGPPVRSKALAYAGTMSYAKVSTGRNLALANWPLGNPGAGGTGYSRHPPHPVHPVHLCQFNPPYLDTRTPVRLLYSRDHNRILTARPSTPGL